MAGKSTERTYYPILIDVIRERDGKGVSEVKYNSEPDIEFDFIDKNGNKA